MNLFLSKLYKNENGQNMVEYGLLIALISVAVLFILVMLGSNLVDIFTVANDALPD